MLALSLLSLFAAEAPASSLETLVKVAALDAHARPPADRPFTRYLSLHAIDEADRADFMKALTLAVNGAQFGGDLVQLKVIAGGRLVRLDLRDLKWDYFSRQIELDELFALGVQFRSDGRPLNSRFVDIWEGIAASEPFFDVHRGVDPALAAAFVKESRSCKPILAAHWLFPRLLLEPQDGGYYSQLLLLPATEADLEKRLGVDRRFTDVNRRAKHGAAVVKSASVAYNPREIQLLQPATGFDAFYYWRTLDFLKDDRRDKDVRESPAGRSAHDGREVLFSLPDGLIGGYLANGQGAQVNVVPQQIAEDQRPHSEGSVYSRTKSVVNYIKCLDCHGESRGFIGFDDNTVKLIVAAPRQDTAYTVEDKYRQKEAIREAQRIEEFYRRGLAQKAEQHRTSFEGRVKECTGLDVNAATRLVVKFYDRLTPAYAAEPVTPEQAAKEMGYPLIVARVLWKVASDPDLYHPPNSQMGFLAAGQPVTRRQFELNVPAAFRVATQPIKKAK